MNREWLIIPDFDNIQESLALAKEYNAGFEYNDFFNPKVYMDEDEIKRYESTLDESVCNGGAALAAYSKLQFSDDVATKALEEALLRYCELDTLAMVFIWEYFNEMI